MTLTGRDAFNSKRFVCFVYAPQTSTVNITAHEDPHAWLKALQPGNPSRLILALVVPTERATEREFRERFAAYEISNGWYRNEGALRDMLAGVQLALGVDLGLDRFGAYPALVEPELSREDEDRIMDMTMVP